MVITETITRAQATAAAVGASALVVLYVLLCLTVLGNARWRGKSYLTDWHLKGIAKALHSYVDSHAEYPRTFVELVGAEFDGYQEKFWAAGDGAYHWDDNFDARNYTSFVYTPGTGSWMSDSCLILAYDREAWTPLGLRVFPRYGRCVLFADGRVDRLDSDAFRAALDADAAARREIGWRVPESN